MYTGQYCPLETRHGLRVSASVWDTIGGSFLNGADLLGRFKAIESFLIRPGNEFGIIGDLVEGSVERGNFVSIRLNSSINILARIDEIKQIYLSGGEDPHTLLLFHEPESDVSDVLHGLNVGSEILQVHATGPECPRSHRPRGRRDPE